MGKQPSIVTAEACGGNSVRRLKLNKKKNDQLPCKSCDGTEDENQLYNTSNFPSDRGRTEFCALVAAKQMLTVKWIRLHRLLVFNVALLASTVTSKM